MKYTLAVSIMGKARLLLAIVAIFICLPASGQGLIPSKPSPQQLARQSDWDDMKQGVDDANAKMDELLWQQQRADFRKRLAGDTAVMHYYGRTFAPYDSTEGLRRYMEYQKQRRTYDQLDMAQRRRDSLNAVKH